MTKILVTGSTGFIGSHLVLYLLKENHEVHVTTRAIKEDVQSISGLTVHLLNSSDSLEKIFSSFKPNVVIHLATNYQHTTSLDAIDAMVSSNIHFGNELLEIMARYGCNKLINTTTCAEFNSKGDYSPNSLYAASKRAFRDICTYYVNCHNLKLIDLVLYDNYGANDTRGKIINILCSSLYIKEPINLSPGEQNLNLVYVDDTVKAIHTSIKKIIEIPTDIGNRNLYCVRPNKPITLKDLAAKMEQTFNRQLNIKWGGVCYRENELMNPWSGPVLPNWNPEISLTKGLKIILSTIDPSSKKTQ